MIIQFPKRRGPMMAFSLVEVVVAVVLVAFLFISLFVGLAQGFALSTAARERLRANQIALERIEGIRLVKWSDLTNAALVPTSFTAQYAPGSASSGVTYTGTVSLAAVNFTPNPTYASQMQKITVNVQWVSGERTYSHTVATLVSRYGMQNYVYNN